jgi:5'-AMP-activated protein kinase regulatory beta subunit
MPKSKNRPNQNGAIEMKATATNQQSREVDFILECNGAEHVYVCGDFNDWRPTCLRMIGNAELGLWAKRLLLPPGRYEYKFVVDGKWLHDHDAMENISNIYGSLNSVVEVQS